MSVIEYNHIGGKSLDLIEVFKALGDENRIRILHLLTKQDLCVCEIETILGITQSNASRHLIKLKNAGIITYEKKSQWVVYMVSEEFIKNYKLFYTFLADEMRKNPELALDAKKLERYKCSSYTCENIKEDKNKVIKCVEGLE